MEDKMQFEKCLTCPAISEQRCTGPKFMRAPTKDLVEWLTAYQKRNGITNAQLAAASGIPKGTIDGLKNRADVRHETFLPLLKAAIEMTGGVWDGESCPVVVDVASEQHQEILHLTEENLRLTEELQREKEKHELSAREIKERTRAIYALFGLCAGLILLLVLICL
jgi:hypothetical protein